ncbi:hypothetical protein CKO28_00130 [Rhodovibrio sodomensis]|uniref:Uncharacterized protein n=1 Tax=Rhodovibrio sodomensis TaxID=1088 RepID=A0ABS1D900_9PROT|nr:hypothetical protein [Rhodovibrio sodomensis]MBK1666446.1 hypothetical protein [Rhodovibrio sodomensis]
MRIIITDTRAKSMARIIERAVQSSGKDRFRYNQALDTVAELLGYADQNALAAQLKPAGPDPKTLDTQALERAAERLQQEIAPLGRDYRYARDHLALQDTAAELEARIERAVTQAAAIGREARKRLKRRHSDATARVLDRARRRAGSAIATAPAPWCQRAHEATGENGQAVALPLPSVLTPLFEEIASLIAPALPETLEASVWTEAGETHAPVRLQLFHDDGHEPRQLFITPVLDGTRVVYRAELDSLTSGMDGGINVEETLYEVIDTTDRLIDAIEACCTRYADGLFANAERQSEDRAQLTLQLEAISARLTAAAPTGGHIHMDAEPDDSADQSGSVADSGSGDQLWLVNVRRVLREDAQVMIRADSRGEAEREGLEYASALCETLTWECYDADYWLDGGCDSERLCTTCGEETGDPEATFCSGGCAGAHASLGRGNS